MIEIILREDVSNYETKPFFGFTYRQVGAIALAAILAFGIFKAGIDAGLPTELLGFFIFLEGVVVALAFLVKIQGMYANKRLPILLTYRKRPNTVWAQNRVFRSSREIKKLNINKKERKKQNSLDNESLKAKAKAKNETEFVDATGECYLPEQLKKKKKQGKAKTKKRMFKKKEKAKEKE